MTLRETPGSTASPLHIDVVALPNGAVLGMSHCPGRQRAGDTPRNLTQDLARIEAWGASTLVSLVQTHEFTRLGVGDFAEAMARTRLRWLQVPIADMQVPEDSTLGAWLAQRGALHAALQRGDKVLVHCAAGLGRTGTLVARLLVDAGMRHDEAIAQVRRARPGTIETREQAEFVASDRHFRLQG